ncbi:MAG: hypothetical protein Q7T63_07615 [Burkholderiaceae bacterium]|nr:hypothetical protein [Burkholderiaceae bacterium]
MILYRPEQRTPPVVQLLSAFIPLPQPEPATVLQRRSATFSPEYIPRIDPRIVTPLPRWQDVDRHLTSGAHQPPPLSDDTPAPRVDADHPQLPRSLLARALALQLIPARRHSVTGRPLDPVPDRSLKIHRALMGDDGPRCAGWPAHQQPQPYKMFVTEQDGRAHAAPAMGPQFIRRPDPPNYMPPATLQKLRHELLVRRVPYNRALLRSALMRFVAREGDLEIERKNREILQFLDQLKNSPAGLRPGAEDYEIMALRVVCGLAQKHNNLSLCEATLARPRAIEALSSRQRGQKAGFFKLDSFRQLFAAAIERSIAEREARQAPEPS